jgi:hypothetical protein
MSCARRAVSGPRCLHQESSSKITEDGLSSDQSQTATANSTITDFSEWQANSFDRTSQRYTLRSTPNSPLSSLPLHIPNPLKYVLDSAGDKVLVSVFTGPSQYIAQSQKGLTIVIYLLSCSAGLRIASS